MCIVFLCIFSFLTLFCMFYYMSYSVFKCVNLI
ncbi:hypothetical protein Leryth_025436, partial [Lithospermum erythrorhizon]